MSKKNKNVDEEVTTFTREQVERFDGRNNRPLYIVFKGKVYDVTRSRLWVLGRHMGVHTRDENLTETIKGAPHGEETLSRYPVVGEFIEELVSAPIPPKPPEKKIVEERAIEGPLEAPIERRDFLKLVAAAGGAVALAALASSVKSLTFIPPSTGATAWPKIKVTNINQLPLLQPFTFNYPLTNTPNYLVKLGVAAQSGVGPDKDIVAFSGICQHLGCFYAFVPPNPTAGQAPKCNPNFTTSIPEGYCCCHGSQYDFVHGAQVISGPAPRPVPQVQLQFDSTSGNINAIAMGPPTIYGHGPPGTTDPALVLKYDLQGGEVVSS